MITAICFRLMDNTNGSNNKIKSYVGLFALCSALIIDLCIATIAVKIAF